MVVQKLSERRGDLQEMRPSGGGRLRLVFHVPTRGLIGYQGELLTDTRGTAVMNRLFHGYAPHKGEIPGRRTGVLISNATGEATAYSLFYLQERGAMMIEPQTRVYAGMIVGEHTRDNDLVVNVIQGKKLSNVRAAGKDENMILTPPHAHDAGAGALLHQRRRAGRDHAQVDPPAGSAGSTPTRGSAASGRARRRSRRFSQIVPARPTDRMLVPHVRLRTGAILRRVGFVANDPRRTSDAWSLGAKLRTLSCGMGVSDEKSFKVRYRRRESTLATLCPDRIRGNLRCGIGEMELGCRTRWRSVLFR